MHSTKLCMKQIRKDLKTELKSLENKLKQVTFDIIKNCKHEYLLVDGFGDPRGKRVVCCNCGLVITAESFTLGYLDLSKSKYVYDPNAKWESCVEFRLDNVAQYAMQVPRRFSLDYLTELFQNTPWSVEDILAADKGDYSITDPLYTCFEDYYEYVKNND